MNIGQAAKLSGVSAKMIRYYEQIDLIPQAMRSDAGYRHYSAADVHCLRFICRARGLGFSVEQITALLVLWRDSERVSAHVKAMALAHAATLREKIAVLESMAQTIEHLADHCHGNDRPDCPILADLGEPKAAVEAHAHAPQRMSRFGIDTPASLHERAAR